MPLLCAPVCPSHVSYCRHFQVNDEFLSVFYFWTQTVELPMKNVPHFQHNSDSTVVQAKKMCTSAANCSMYL